MSLTIQDLSASAALDQAATSALRGGYSTPVTLPITELPGRYVLPPFPLGAPCFPPGVPIEIFGGHATPYF